MDRLTKVVFIILVAFSLDRLCTLVPGHIFINDPFPFFDLSYIYEGTEYHSISLQAYVKAVTTHISWIILLFAFRKALPVSMERLLLYMIGIEFLSLADFFLLYEQPIFKVGAYRVEFTDFKILGHATAILLWKTGRL